MDIRARLIQAVHQIATPLVEPRRISETTQIGTKCYYNDEIPVEQLNSQQPIGRWRITPGTESLGRLVLTFAVITSLISMLAFFGLRYASDTAKDSVIEALEDSEKRVAEAMAGRIEETLYNITADLLFIRRSIERQLAGEMAESTLSTLLVDFADSHNVYDQVRFLNSAGMEVIRVNKAEDGAVLVDASALQDKSDAAYVRAARDLPADGFIVTPIDANHENGVVQYPLKPVTRVMVPVLGRDGAQAGLAIINYEVQYLLDALIAIGAAAVGTPMTINAAGRSALEDFRKGDVDTIISDNDERVLFPDRYPQAWAIMQSTPEGIIRSEQVGMLTYVSFSPEQIATSGRFQSDIHWYTPDANSSKSATAWILGSRVDPATLQSIASDSQHRSFITELVFALLICALSWLLALQMTGLRSRAGEMRELAIRDHLTGLLNRREFEQRFEGAIKHAQRFGRPMALLYIDLNGFKAINDTLGHSAGDVLLQKTSEVLKNCVRQSDIVGRLGGDEFAIALRETRSPEDAEVVLGYVKEKLARPIEINGQAIAVSASVGAATFPENGNDLKHLSDHADAAMYRDKACTKASMAA